MKLIKDLKINVYEVIADYKVKVENAPFIAILKFAEENNGKITPSLLHRELLKPLSEKACENLLERLEKTGYFKKYEDENIFDIYLLKKKNNFTEQKYNYKLTTSGYESAQKEEFYEQRYGLLKLYVAANNEFAEQQVVKIIEHDNGKYDEFDKDTKIQNLNSDLKNLLNDNILYLKNGSFILDKFEQKCKILKSEIKQLVFTANEVNSTVKIMDFENIESYTKQQTEDEILKNEYSRYYDTNNRILKTDFNPNELQLQINISVDKPAIRNTVFNKAEIKNVKISPKTINDAKKWYLALLKWQISKYIFTETEFEETANNTADKFELFKEKLNNSVSRKQLISKLDNTNNFYLKAKLETIDFLNY